MLDDSGKDLVLRKVEDLRKTNGNVMSHQVRWKPTSWERQGLGVYKHQISKFAAECRQVDQQHVISRQDVITLSESAEGVFIGAMIFGYGLIGYGPSRVEQIVQVNHDLIAKLNRQYKAAVGGSRKSWVSHTQEDRVKYLGPAFATKFAYFAARKQRIGQIVPLIADINTSWAMWNLAGIPSSVKSQESYMAYVDLAHNWGKNIESEFGADEVELALFKIGVDMRKTFRNLKK